MREILFRGKRIDNGEWVGGNLFVNMAGDKYEIILGYTTARFASEVIPETIGQYTGVTDKDDTRIFEGDILKFDYIGKNCGVNGKANVIFENGKFGVLWGWHKDFVCLDEFANTTIEVIGNVYDNPELLKGGEGQWITTN